MIEPPCNTCLNYYNWDGEPETCEWTYEPYEGSYDTRCNQVFQFTDGDLDDNPEFKFCPFCGREIKEVVEEDDE